MADNDNVDNVSDDSEALPELTLADLTPKFGPLAALVLLAYNAHRAWVVAHAAKFGTDSPKFAAWRDSLALTDVLAGMVTPADMADEHDETVTVYDAARLSSDPEFIASLIFYLSECLSAAKENLQGIYYDARKVPTDNTSDAVALRAEVDSYWTALKAMAETPQLDMAELRKILPTKVKIMPKSGARRIDYDGPTIPQTRKSSGFRSNARLAIWLESAPGSGIVGQLKVESFGEACKVIGFTVQELRDAFFPDGLKLNEWHTLPDGRKFHLRKVDKT